MTSTVAAIALNSSVPPTALPVPPLQLSCTPLTPRLDPPRSVRDLRPDDIRVVAGIGDSVMAGFGAKGIQTRFLSPKTLAEDRGISFAMGGDDGAITIPNLIHFYSRQLYGSSIGSQFITVCFGPTFCPDGQYRPSIGVLNAAQSGARSANLDHEIDYLLEQLDDAYKAKTIQSTDWKLLTFFVGSNDMCHSCFVPASMPQTFSIDVLAAVERIRMTVPNVLVQIVGMFEIDQIFVETQAYPKYCHPFPISTFTLQDQVCGCAHTAANRTMMSNLLPLYNSALQSVVTYYNDPKFTANETFGIFYQPLPADIKSFPIDAIRSRLVFIASKDTKFI
ncbi:hypothetical protein CLU79DRAFT_805829 [Phycomyces nitens]|nr:hypothetical protein CLU79DRAFT_805829 [Phycomyces nitens]